MALSLLLIALMMSASLHTACFVSPKGPPVSVESSNHRPQIVTETVQPQYSENGPIIVTCASDQIDVDFQVATIIDFDVEQWLHVRWFIDYDPHLNMVNSRPFAEQEVEGHDGGSAERDVDISVRVPLNWLPLTTRLGTHLVEVVVSDAPPLSVGELPYRSFPPGGLSDTYSWVIEVQESEGCQ